MPHSHKKKTRAVKCCLAVGLLAIAAAIGVLFGPSALVLAQGRPALTRWRTTTSAPCRGSTWKLTLTHW